MQLAWKVEEGSKVKLKNYDPDYIDKYTDRALASAELEKLSEELSELQQLLAAAQHHSLLMVLQGMDTSGKDGTIRQVMAHVNPQGCEVRSFKGPTPREMAHDFLWRIHRVTPGRGMISIFNRSHYEDLLAMRSAQAGGDEPVERRAQRLARRTAKHVFRGVVEQYDHLRVVHGDDGVHGRRNDAREPRFAVTKHLVLPAARRGGGEHGSD